MKVFALASSVLATSIGLVSAAAVAPANHAPGQLTSTYGSFGDGVYRSEVINGKEVYRFTPPTSSPPAPQGQSTHVGLGRRSADANLERRWWGAAAKPETECDKGKNILVGDTSDINRATNSMLEKLLKNPHFSSHLSSLSGNVVIYCCNNNGNKGVTVTPEYLQTSLGRLSMCDAGDLSYGYVKTNDKKMSNCGRTWKGDHFCHKKNKPYSD
ncbi:MAG: hypothetical protein M1823_004425 [Watsoniomyces obsoletus]|nr:MAG: hypothetical protein M1823_004425 [Watsoniomyces obsoletus]